MPPVFLPDQWLYIHSIVFSFEGAPLEAPALSAVNGREAPSVYASCGRLFADQMFDKIEEGQQLAAYDFVKERDL